MGAKILFQSIIIYIGVQKKILWKINFKKIIGLHTKKEKCIVQILKYNYMEVKLVKLKKRNMSDLLMKLEGVKMILNQKIEMAIHFLYQKVDNKYVNLNKK